MTEKELREYAESVGVPMRDLNKLVEYFFKGEDRELNVVDTVLAKTMCSEIAAEWESAKRNIEMILEHSRKMKEKRKEMLKEKGLE